MKKYRVTRTVTVKVSSVITSYLDRDELKETLDTEAKSLAGTLSELGLTNLYDNVEYTSGETTVTEIN